MQNLDDIFYEAITADEALVAVVGGRVTSTCVPIPPDQQDTTDLPYLIITDDPFTNDMATKDDEWESDVDRVQAGIIINAESPAEVKRIRKMVRKAIAEYVKAMEEPPTLLSLTNEGVQWDWQKPCYFDTLHYQCEITLYDDED
jgi:hypothetical protein